MSPNQRPALSTGPRPINNYFRVIKTPSGHRSSFGKTKSSRLSFGQVTLNQRPVEAIDLTEVGPERQDSVSYSSSARGQLSLSQPLLVQNVATRRDGPEVVVAEEVPKFLALCINFNVPTPPDHYQTRYSTAPNRLPIQLHTGDPKSCFDFITANPPALLRTVALVLHIRHTQDPAHWMVFLDKALGKVRIGGLFTDLLASYMKLRLGEDKVSFYIPPAWEKPRPIVFFSSAEACEKNARIAGLWRGFVWKVDVSEPTGLSRFLEDNPNFGNRIDELSIRVYDEESAQEWIELFHRLGREATWLENLRIYWDQLSRETPGEDINVLSVDKGIIGGLASIKVKHSLVLVGLYAPLLVLSLEEKTGLVGRKMQDGNYVLKHQYFGRDAVWTYAED